MTALEEKIVEFYQDMEFKTNIKSFLYSLPVSTRLTGFEALKQTTDAFMMTAFEEVKKETLDNEADDVENSVRWFQKQFGTKLTKEIVLKILAELPEEGEEEK